MWHPIGSAVAVFCMREAAWIAERDGVMPVVFLLRIAIGAGGKVGRYELEITIRFYAFERLRR